MQASSILIIILAYFGMLILVSKLVSSKTNDNSTFFSANKSSPWYLVAFGMIGASLSGVTFVSVPGWVESSNFSYFQLVLGYIIGYIFIINILLPLYYKLNLTSIYTYLNERFGRNSYKTGAWFFILSRLVGSNLRLMLVANILQTLVFDEYHIPYWITVIITLLLIWVYTYRSGIQTIVWTDTIQTVFMLVSLFVTIYIVSNNMGINIPRMANFISESKFSKTFYFGDILAKENFWKQFLSGVFIAIAMTGLDQDMMQKNLTCRNIKDAQKNMSWFVVVLTIVNFAFLVLGLLLTEYAIKNGIDAHGDTLFTILSTKHLGTISSLFFILGIISAAYSSADSALASLTTSFCVDILEIEKKYPEEKQVNIRKLVHISFVIVSAFVIIIFKYGTDNSNIINQVLKFAGFTYGPLLGIYFFGLFTKIKIHDKFVPLVALLSFTFSIILNLYSEKWFNYKFGSEILIFNGLFTFLGLHLFRKK